MAASEKAPGPDGDRLRRRFKKSDKLEELEGSQEGKRIYRAVDKDTMFEVAWHELPLTPDYEAEGSVPTLEHKHLLRVLAKWEEEDEDGRHLVVITEIVDAGTLASHTERIKHDVRTKVVKKWCRQILSGLQFLHETTGRAHGDVRLNNIFMVGVSGDIRLGYLDIEAFHQPSSQSSGTSGTSSASIPYRAPEGTASIPGDIYAFGICLLHIVTGEIPFWVEPGESSTQAMAAKSEGKPPKTLETYKVDESVERIVRACTALDPGKRPSAADLLQDRWLSRKASAASLPGAAQPTPTAQATSATTTPRIYTEEELKTLPRNSKANDGKPTLWSILADQGDSGPFPKEKTACIAKILETQKPQEKPQPSGESTPAAGGPEPSHPAPGEAQPPRRTDDDATVAGDAVSTTAGPDPVRSPSPAASGQGQSSASSSSSSATGAATPRAPEDEPQQQPQQQPQGATATTPAPEQARRGTSTTDAVMEDPSGPDFSLPRLEGMTFEAFTFRRNKVSAQMSLFFHPEQPVKRGVIRYRSVKFNVWRDDAGETTTRLAAELVHCGLVHPEDEEAAAIWLDMSLGHLISAPYAYTRAMLPQRLQDVAGQARNSRPQASGAGLQDFDPASVPPPAAQGGIVVGMQPASDSISSNLPQLPFSSGEPAMVQQPDGSSSSAASASASSAGVAPYAASASATTPSGRDPSPPPAGSAVSPAIPSNVPASVVSDPASGAASPRRGDSDAEYTVPHAGAHVLLQQQQQQQQQQQEQQ